MRVRPLYRMPPHQEQQLQKAKRLEWITIAFMVSIIVVMGLTMGSSQAMWAAWIEDCLSMIPPLAFLTGLHFRSKPPDDEFPYGYRRSVSIAYLCAAITLTSFGAIILYDSLMVLAKKAHPTIGTVSLFGSQIWLGWLMMAALLYSAIPPVVLGRMKLPLSVELHEKVIYTDANMNNADWLTAVAGILGIAGIGIGWWWADAVAAGIISLDVLNDGLKNLKRSVTDLMDKKPTTVERNKEDPLLNELRTELNRLDWVVDCKVRLREEGDVLAGEAYVVPRDENRLTERLEQATTIANSYHWRIYDVIVTSIRSLEDQGNAKRKNSPTS